MEGVPLEKRQLRLAVAGCAHGEMDKIYAALAEIEGEQGYKFDLLICCGDYQAVRNFGDLHHMHVKEKFRDIQTFYKYYSGEKKAPILTLFVGGNHEATGFLLELPNGGWVARNIYYMGFANVINFAGLRIAGLSGIYNAKDYNKGHFERPPFSNGSEVSAYHVRSLDMFRLKQLRPRDGEVVEQPIDIMVTHDWPAGVTDYGDVNQLLRFKPFFKEDIEMGRLGNPASMQLMQEIYPRYWLSAHLHCGFAALVSHKERAGSRPAPTRFLALDKPIKARHFVQALSLEIPASCPLVFSYDPVWLAILKNTNKFTKVSEQSWYAPSVHSAADERWDFRPTDEELQEVLSLGDLTVPERFEHTAPPLLAITPAAEKEESSEYYRNPQSAHFCEWLGIEDLNKLLAESKSFGNGTPYYLTRTEGAGMINTEQDSLEFGDLGFVVDGAAAEAEETRRATTDEWMVPKQADELLKDFEAPDVKVLLPDRPVIAPLVTPLLKRRKVTDLPDEE